MIYPPEGFRLPLPRRIWWPWDQTADLVHFERAFSLSAPAAARLYISASGAYSLSLDAQPVAVPEGPLPSWRSMHVIDLQLAAGPHSLSIAAQPGGHSQPFLLACLDWQSGGETLRLASDSTWRMALDPSAAWRPAWAFDGVWAEPWGFPCNAPLDFCRMSTGWQEVECQPLTRVTALFQGLVTQGAAAALLPGAALRFSPAWPPAARHRQPASAPGMVSHPRGPLAHQQYLARPV